MACREVENRKTESLSARPPRDGSGRDTMSGLASSFQADQAGSLPDHLGLEWTFADAGHVEGRIFVGAHHLASNNYLHAASVIALADTACGYGCRTLLPEGATDFTTAELKANFLGTAREGTVTCVARVAHAGRTTHVWDAEVRNDDTGKRIALFRCTQIILYPRGATETATRGTTERSAS